MTKQCLNPDCMNYMVTYPNSESSCPSCAYTLQTVGNRNSGAAEAGSGRPEQPRRQTRTNGQVETVRGTVYNFYEEQSGRGIFYQLYQSIVYGVPFVPSGQVSTFQVQGSENGESYAHQVVLHGRIIRGRFSDNNVVRVEGRRDYSNTILARRVVNEATDSNVTLEFAVPAGVIRFLGAVFVMLVIYLFMLDWDVIAQSLLDFIVNIVMLALPIIILIVVLLFFIKRLFR